MNTRDSRIRLVFLVRSLDYGGAQRQLVTLAKALDKVRFDVTVLSFYSAQPFEPELADSGVRLISLNKLGRWDILPFVWRLLREAKRLRPDVIHGYLDIPNLLALFTRPFAGARVVWGVRASEIELGHYGWLLRFAAWFERLCAHCPDLIIVNSQAAFEYHSKRGFPARQMVVIPNGIDTEEFKPDSAQRAKLRNEWLVSEEEKLMGAVGRIDPVKDLPVFLKAAAIVQRQVSAVRFACVGGGPVRYVEQLKKLGADLGITDKIIWAGAHDDVAAVYNALDLLVSASRGESFSNVVAEAMSCGIPCVVTDVGDSALLVGECGIVVPPRNPEALAEGIMHALNKCENDPSGNVRIRIRENFSVQRLVELTEAALVSLVRWGP